MARFCPLFSSSKGNSYFMGGADGNILIDVGVSAKKIENALRSIDADPAGIGAIFITHEHSDHVAGLRVFASRYGIKVYGTCGTLAALEKSGHLKGVEYEAIDGHGVQTMGMDIRPFSTPHDSAQSCGYRIKTADGRKIAVATDIGVMTERVRNAITGCDLVVIESNHDVRMVRGGAYPQFLKERILSDRGHLSNSGCAKELARLVENGTTRFYLGHLSRENNVPSLAYRTAVGALESAGMKNNRDYILVVAAPENTDAVNVF